MCVTFSCFASPCSNGSATSEDLFWKLDALQVFVLDLHWPEPEFAKHLEQRLKLMASDMMEACIKRSGRSPQSGSATLILVTSASSPPQVSANWFLTWKKNLCEALMMVLELSSNSTEINL